MTQRAPQAPAPGWYPDPADPGRDRLWAGSGWTSRTRIRGAVPSTAPHAPSSPFSEIVESMTSDRRVEEPAQRRTGSRALDVTGTVLVAAGLIAALYLGWTFVGTNVHAAFVQSRDRAHLEATTPIPAETPTSVPNPTPLSEGEVAGRVSIPSIGVDQILYSGTEPSTLANGPGIWAAGALPGMPGNATISGHRTTHGAPFRHIDQLAPGDRIVVSLTGQPDAVYEVRGATVVEPSRVQVTHSAGGVRLTLTTCEPVGSDAARLVVQAELVEGTHAAEALPPAEWQLQQ